MGLEYISQPQVFLAPITAVNGIQGVNNPYPLLTTYQSWVSTGVVNTSAFPIPGAWTMLDASGSFIVTVGNVIQSPTDYSIDRTNRILTFSSIVTAGVEVGATQLATASPSATSFDSVQSVSGSFVELSAFNVRVQNLTAFGDFTRFDTLLILTSAMSITNSGTGPALFVNQTGAQPIANFQDDGNSVLFVADGGNVGIGTSAPNQRLTVVGNISATGDVISNDALLSFGSANTTTASPGQIFFGANSDIPLDANSRYEITFDVYYSKTTATTVIYALSGTTTFANAVANYIQQPAAGIAANGAVTGAGVVAQTAALIPLPATASLTTGVNHYATIKAFIETSAAVRLNLTAWNGAAGTITPLRGSYWKEKKLN